MKETGFEIIGTSCFVVLERVYCLDDELIINPGKVQKGAQGGRGGRGGGGPWVEFSGKCSSTRAARDAPIEVVVEPSESVRWPIELELILC